MNSGVFFFLVGLGLVVASIALRTTAWALPLGVGAAAAVLAALYQRWWSDAVFDADTDANRQREPLRRRLRRARVH